MNIKERLEAMLESGHDNALLRFGLGNYYFNEKQYKQAITHLEICIKQDESHAVALKLLGRSLMALGEKPEAERIFERGLAVAKEKGNKQVEREITVFLKKLQK